MIKRFAQYIKEDLDLETESDFITEYQDPWLNVSEESIAEFTEEELIEITPQHLRLRKRILSTTERLRYEKKHK